MAEHEPCVGASDDWYTPPFIFDALGLVFDLDPCSPGAGRSQDGCRAASRIDERMKGAWRRLWMIE